MSKELYNAMKEGTPQARQAIAIYDTLTGDEKDKFSEAYRNGDWEYIYSIMGRQQFSFNSMIRTIDKIIGLIQEEEGK